MYTGSAHQLWEQFRAAIFVIFWSALITFILMKLIGWVLRGARYKDEILEVGDLAIHGEEAFPEDSFATRPTVPSPWPVSKEAHSRTIGNPAPTNRRRSLGPDTPERKELKK